MMKDILERWPEYDNSRSQLIRIATYLYLEKVHGVGIEDEIRQISFVLYRFIANYRDRDGKSEN